MNGQRTCAHVLFFLWSTLWAFFFWCDFLSLYRGSKQTVTLQPSSCMFGDIKHISNGTLTLSSTHTVFLCSHSNQWPNTHMVSHCLLMQSFYTWHYISDWTLTLSSTHTVFLCSHSLLDATSVTEHSHGLTLSYAVILYLTLHQWLNTYTISHCLLMQSFYTWHHISDWTLTLALQLFSYICAVAYSKSMTGSSMMLLVSHD